MTSHLLRETEIPNLDRKLKHDHSIPVALKNSDFYGREVRKVKQGPYILKEKSVILKSRT